MNSREMATKGERYLFLFHPSPLAMVMVLLLANLALFAVSLAYPLRPSPASFKPIFSWP